MQYKGIFSQLIKSVIIGSGLTVFLVFLTALFVQQLIIDENAIAAISAAIKVLSSAIAAITFINGYMTSKLFMGALAGICYAIVTAIICALLGGGFHVDLSLLTDIGIGAITGALVSIIASVSSGKQVRS